MIDSEDFKKLTYLIELFLTSKTRDSLLDCISEIPISLFGASASSIVLFEREKENLTIVRTRPLSTFDFSVIKLAGGKSIADEVCLSKKPKLINNLEKFFADLGDQNTAQRAKQDRLGSMVSFPLLVQEKSMGCLNIYYNSPIESFPPSYLLNLFIHHASLSIDHFSTFDEVQKKARMSSLLGEIGLMITSSFDINEIVKIFLSTATRITATDQGGIILIDTNKMKVTTAFEYNSLEGMPKRYKSTARLIDGISGEIIRTLRPVIIPDLTKYPNVNPRALEKGRIALIGLPLIAKGRILGILYVNASKPREFTEDDLYYLSILSSYASVAIENSRLYESLTREAEQFAILYDIGKSFISTLDFDRLLSNILSRLSVFFGELNLAVFLVDEEKNELKLHTYINYPDEVKNLRIKIGETGIAGHVAGTRMMYYAPDVTKDPYYIRGVRDAKSEVCFPLIVGNKLIGVLDVESHELDRFGEDDINLLSTISTEIAIALENSRLYEETRRLSLTDPLTALPNRRSFDLFIENEIKRAERFHRPFSLLMIDFDNFKDYNDQFGHSAGDDILRRFSQLMKNCTRNIDFLGRYGGDEFIAVLSETDCAVAYEVSERMRKVIEAQKTCPSVTLSIGIAHFPTDSTDKTKLISLADQACYEAKQQGGNCIKIASELKGY